MCICLPIVGPIEPFQRWFWRRKKQSICSNSVNSMRIALQTYKRFITLEKKVMYVFCVSPLMIWAFRTLLFHQQFNVCIVGRRLYDMMQHKSTLFFIRNRTKIHFWSCTFWTVAPIEGDIVCIHFIRLIICLFANKTLSSRPFCKGWKEDGP